MTDEPIYQDEQEPDAAETVDLAFEDGLDTTPFDTAEDVTEVREPDRFSAFWETPALPKRKTGRLVLAWFLAALIGAVGGGLGSYYAFKDDASAAGVNVVEPLVRGGTANTSGVSAVARAVLPSIAQIRTDTDIAGNPRGIGSAVIYRADGYLVTNHHVVERARHIEARLATGESVTGALVGTAWPRVDIAVIKLARGNLPAATFGTTKDLQVGDLAVAIGSPFGLEATVTSGVISALHRNELASQASPDAIQTDASINQGNSGGALVDARGTVIGINSSILSQSGGNVGIGFAIPVDIVRKVADQIIRDGRVRLAYLGVSGDSVPDDGGALVRGVERNGPADRAGIRVNDVIVQIGEQRIASMDGLIAHLIEKEPGDRVTITLERDGRTVAVTATLGERPASE